MENVQNYDEFVNEGLKINEEGPLIPIMMMQNVARGKNPLPLFQYDDDDDDKDDDDNKSYSNHSSDWFILEDMKKLKEDGFKLDKEEIFAEEATKTMGDFTIIIKAKPVEFSSNGDILLIIKDNSKKWIKKVFKKRFYSVWSAMDAYKTELKKLGYKEPAAPRVYGGDRPNPRPANRRQQHIDPNDSNSKYGEENWESKNLKDHKGFVMNERKKNKKKGGKFLIHDNKGNAHIN